MPVDRDVVPIVPRALARSGVGYVGLQLAGAVVGERERDRLRELGDADRRDEHDHALAP